MKKSEGVFGRRFSRFVVVGGVAAAVNVGSRILLSQVLPFRTAVVLAYPAGMLVAWSLSRLFVFDRVERRWQAELARFAVVNLFGALQVWIVSIALAEWLFPRIGFEFHTDLVAHLIGVAVPAFSSYLGHKHFTFARAGESPDAVRQ